MRYSENFFCSKDHAGCSVGNRQQGMGAGGEVGPAVRRDMMETLTAVVVVLMERSGAVSMVAWKLSQQVWGYRKENGMTLKI